MDQVKINEAEYQWIYATLRLRALKQQRLMQNGDSFNAYFLQKAMEELGREFGNNLKIF